MPLDPHYVQRRTDCYDGPQFWQWISRHIAYDWQNGHYCVLVNGNPVTDTQSDWKYLARLRSGAGYYITVNIADRMCVEWGLNIREYETWCEEQ